MGMTCWMYDVHLWCPFVSSTWKPCWERQATVGWFGVIHPWACPLWSPLHVIPFCSHVNFRLYIEGWCNMTQDFVVSGMFCILSLVMPHWFVSLGLAFTQPLCTDWHPFTFMTCLWAYLQQGDRQALGLGKGILRLTSSHTDVTRYGVVFQETRTSLVYVM